MKTRHFLDTDSFTKEELVSMIGMIQILKDAEKQGIRPQLLKNQSLAMIFDQQSTRTRISLEVAMTHLGGHALFLESKSMHMNERETLKDTAEVISSMCDAISVRTDYQTTIEEIANNSSVPVFNAMTLEDFHPIQALNDIFTMTEHKLKGKKLEDLVVTFVGDSRFCTGISMGKIVTKLGMTYAVCAPDEIAMPAEEHLQKMREFAKESGGNLIVTKNIKDVIAKTDFLVTDAWWYHGQFDSDDERKDAIKLLQEYSINKEMMSEAPAHCRVMHNLPGNRGYEITDEVWDGPQSILIPQAENRLHTQKGLLAWFMSPKEASVKDESNYSILINKQLEDRKKFF